MTVAFDGTASIAVSTSSAGSTANSFENCSASVVAIAVALRNPDYGIESYDVTSKWWVEPFSHVTSMPDTSGGTATTLTR